jgi:hypothetical protein
MGEFLELTARALLPLRWSREVSGVESGTRTSYRGRDQLPPIR